ncbi:MAG: RNA polymerase sigma factor [Armatimonas sp.]
MRDLDDDTLLNRAKAGDTSAFGVLVRRHQELLIAFAARMLSGDLTAGEDVAQEALLRLWHARTTWQPEGKLRSWLIRTTFRLCLDEKRRPIPLELTESDQAMTSPDLELCLAVRAALELLPETHRAVFLLSAYHGLSYDEIATALCLPPGTVASRKHHAVQHLRRQLADLWETPHA